MDLTDKSQVELPEVLRWVSAELTYIGELFDNLQISLSSEFLSRGRGNIAGQDLDLVRQLVEGLQEFTTALAGDCKDTWVVVPHCAANGLRLHSQKLRLGSQSPQPIELQGNGTVELF